MGMKPCSSEGHRSTTRSRDIYPSMPIFRFQPKKKEAEAPFPANGLGQGVPNHMFLIDPCLNLLLIYGTRRATPTPSHRK